MDGPIHEQLWNAIPARIPAAWQGTPDTGATDSAATVALLQPKNIACLPCRHSALHHHDAT